MSLVGLSAILVEYHWLTWLIRILGGGYLLYLGVRLLWTRAAPVDIAAAAPPSRHRAILFGFIVTLTNPKAIVLFASVFATAVTATTPTWLMALMIKLVGGSALIWNSVVSCFMASDPIVRRFQRTRHWIERTAGGCFVALRGKVLADARNPLAP